MSRRGASLRLVRTIIFKDHKSVPALAMGRIRVVRIIDRLNVGGPAKHGTWLTAGLDPERFETR